MTAQVKITIQQLINALLDEDKPIHPRYLYRLSDITPQDLDVLKKSWPSVPVWRRQAIMEDITLVGEDNYTLSFENVARLGVNDPDPRVRELSVRVLLEYELPELVDLFVQTMDHDPDTQVRAVSATALGQYIYLGEIEEIPEKTLHKLEDRLLRIVTTNEPELLRRRALESLGYSSRKEVPGLIETAYHSGNTEWIVSALIAMGRSSNKIWARPVLDMLLSDVDDIRCGAARAAGELEIGKARSRLLRLLRDEDTDVRLAAAWSLSQIGGEGVEEALEALLEQTDDEEEIEFLDSALENLSFTEETELFALLELSDESEDSEDDDLDDLDEIDDDLDEFDPEY